MLILTARIHQIILARSEFSSRPRRLLGRVLALSTPESTRPL